MKKIIFLFFIIILLMGCYWIPDEPVEILINYNGEYYVFMHNISEDETGHLFVVWGEGQSVWSYDELEYNLGGPANKFEVKAVKVLGELYPDYGNLVLRFAEDGEILAEDIALKGDQEAFIFYDF